MRSAPLPLTTICDACPDLPSLTLVTPLDTRLPAYENRPFRRPSAPGGTERLRRSRAWFGSLTSYRQSAYASPSVGSPKSCGAACDLRHFQTIGACPHTVRRRARVEPCPRPLPHNRRAVPEDIPAGEAIPIRSSGANVFGGGFGTARAVVERVQNLVTVRVSAAVAAISVRWQVIGPATVRTIGVRGAAAVHASVAPLHALPRTDEHGLIHRSMPEGRFTNGGVASLSLQRAPSSQRYSSRRHARSVPSWFFCTRRHVPLG